MQWRNGKDNLNGGRTERITAACVSPQLVSSPLLSDVRLIHEPDIGVVLVTSWLGGNRFLRERRQARLESLPPLRIHIEMAWSRQYLANLGAPSHLLCAIARAGGCRTALLMQPLALTTNLGKGTFSGFHGLPRRWLPDTGILAWQT